MNDFFETQSRFERWPTKPGPGYFAVYSGMKYYPLIFQDVEPCCMLLLTFFRGEDRKHIKKRIEKTPFFREFRIKMEPNDGLQFKVSVLICLTMFFASWVCHLYSWSRTADWVKPSRSIVTACTSLRKDMEPIWTVTQLKRKIIFQISIFFVFHVNLPGCPIFFLPLRSTIHSFGKIAGDIFNVGDPLPEVPVDFQAWWSWDTFWAILSDEQMSYSITSNWATRWGLSTSQLSKLNFVSFPSRFITIWDIKKWKIVPSIEVFIANLGITPLGGGFKDFLFLPDYLEKWSYLPCLLGMFEMGWIN